MTNLEVFREMGEIVALVAMFVAILLILVMINSMWRILLELTGIIKDFLKTEVSDKGYTAQSFMAPPDPIVDKTVAPGKMHMMRDETLEFHSPAPSLLSVDYRKHWWQFWRPRLLWLVKMPQSYAVGVYKLELFDKNNPAHKDLGKPGFTGLKYQGEPVKPDGKLFMGDDLKPRREGKLTEVEDD